MHERYQLVDRLAGTRLADRSRPAFGNLDDLFRGGVIALLTDHPERVLLDRGPGCRFVSLVSRDRRTIM